MKGNVQAIHGLYVAGNMACAPLKLVQTAASQGAVTGAKVNSGGSAPQRDLRAQLPPRPRPAAAQGRCWRSS